MLAFCRNQDIILVPQTQAWQEAIEAYFGQKAQPFTRYATKKVADFDEIYLQSLVNQLPKEFELKRIDESVYQKCLEEEWSRDLVANYADYQQYWDLGIGFVLLADGQLVAGASSYSTYQGGIEVEIDTREDYREKGLATICGAKLILACLDVGLYPSWDAHTTISLALAKKLGYVFAYEYRAYEIED